MVESEAVLRGKGLRTRERILSAAEKLFAEQGFSGASMRGITAAAKVNLSVAYYYFKDKKSLLHAVIDRHVLPAMEEMGAMLDAARAEAGTAAIPLRRLLESLVLPRAHCVSDAAHRFFAALMIRRGETEKMIFEMLEVKTAALQRRFFEEFARTLPHLSPLELRFRIESFDAMLCGWRTVCPLREGKYPKNVSAETYFEMLMTFAVPSFLAPATVSPKNVGTAGTGN